MRFAIGVHRRGRPFCAGLVGVRHVAVVMLGVACFSSSAFAQSKNTLLGEWRGTSTCLVRPSPCNDEVVVYEISAIGTRTDSINIKASKIVRGELEYMGDVQCLRAAASPQLECRMPNGTWRFRLDGARTPAALIGELFLTSGVKYRDIIVRRSP